LGAQLKKGGEKEKKKARNGDMNLSSEGGIISRSKGEGRAQKMRSFFINKRGGENFLH